MTAIYEITPAGAKQRQIDPLRYRTERDRSTPSTIGRSDEMAFVKLRYKLPAEATSRLIEQPVRAADALAKFANAARGPDPEGYRAEFVRLIRMAETLGAVAQR